MEINGFELTSRVNQLNKFLISRFLFEVQQFVKERLCQLRPLLCAVLWSHKDAVIQDYAPLGLPAVCS